MHFEIYVEDASGKKVLDLLVPMVIGSEHSFKVYPYKGIGHIPANMSDPKDAAKRILLHNLPKILKGLGKTFKNYGNSYNAAAVIVCDLDKKCFKQFRQELFNILDVCDPKPMTVFCIAIEEMEAWFLGDINAIKRAYPKAKTNILVSYENDSICDTWEKLADAVYSGGATKLLGKGWQTVGREKSVWAEKITPHLNINDNKSQSFQYFVKKLQSLI